MPSGAAVPIDRRAGGRRTTTARSHPGSAGFSLLEILVVLAVSVALAALLTPPLLSLTALLRTRLAATEVVAALRQAQAWAVRHDARVAVKFRRSADGRVTFGLYRDGDGDGVRSRDIETGVDPPVEPPHPLLHLGRAIRFGFPPGPMPSDPGDPRRRLGRPEDPIRFNRSDLASFSPLGGSTPGSIYVTDGRRELFVVRVLGRTGRIRMERYDRDRDTWR